MTKSEKLFIDFIEGNWEEFSKRCALLGEDPLKVYDEVKDGFRTRKKREGIYFCLEFIFILFATFGVISSIQLIWALITWVISS